MPVITAPARLGIDFGGTKIALGVVAEDGAVLQTWRLTTRIGEAAPAGLEELLATVQEVRDSYPSLAEIGVGICCQVDPATGQVDGADATIPGWQSLDLAGTLAASSGLPVVMDNDANAAALGEGWVGAAQGLHDYVVLTIGTGVGGGIVANGRLLTGAWGGAAELGHIPLDPDGPVCYCGSRGCLEQLIAGPALERTASGLGLTSAAALFERAGRDEAALRMVTRAGQWLAISTILLVNIFQPQAVLYGGGVMQGAAPFWLPLVRTAVAAASFPTNRRVRLLEAALGSAAGIVGAAALVGRNAT